MEGAFSKEINLCQGVRRGWVLSTDHYQTEHYKRYKHPLLLQLEEKVQGATKGNINIPPVTCADVLALLSCSDSDMKLMVNAVLQYSKNYVYRINPSNSSILQYNSKEKI